MKIISNSMWGTRGEELCVLGGGGAGRVGWGPGSTPSRVMQSSGNTGLQKG